MAQDQIADFTKLLPVLIADATLLAMVNLRNSDLATRYRNNVKEAIYDCELDERKRSLRNQNRILLFRYVLTSITFLVLAFSLACFAINGLTGIEPQVGGDLTTVLGQGWLWTEVEPSKTFNFRFGVDFFLFGLLLTMIEFAIGFITLRMDGGFTRA